MEDINYTIRSIDLKSTKEKKEITDFLAGQGLELDPDVEYTSP